MRCCIAQAKQRGGGRRWYVLKKRRTKGGDLLVITTPCSQQVETFHAVQWKLWLLAECHL